MIAIISPSKGQDFSDPFSLDNYTQPEFLDESEILIKELRNYSPEKISQLMSLSEKLSDLNFGRYQNFITPFTQENSRQALGAFRGDVYTDIEIEAYSNEDFDFAQDHLRILSGLYGILKPLDLIQPYRLEMKIKLKNPKGKDLYAFWGNRLSESLQHELDKHVSPVLVNLASQEYFKALRINDFPQRVINIYFKERKVDQYKIIALFAKRARGMMSNFIIQNRIDQPEGLKDFTASNYLYNSTLSTANDWVFTRDSNS